MRARSVLVFAIKLAIFVIVAGTLYFFAVIVWVAKAQSPDAVVRNPFARFPVRALRFRDRVMERHPQCTVSEAWRLSSFDDLRAMEAIRAGLKVLDTDGPYTRVMTPLGPLWMPSRDVYAVAESIFDQQQEIYQTPESGVRSGDIVLDCGANIGIYTKYALSKGARHVVAIEVAPEDIESLRRNLGPEIAAGKVTLYPKGVWDKDATLELRTSPQMSSMANSVARPMDTRGPVVALTTIDKIVKELKLSRVDFIKMDIEGAEANALRGASEAIRVFRPRMAIALEHRRSDPDQLPELIRSGWQNYRIRLSGCIETGSRAYIQPGVMYAYPN